MSIKLQRLILIAIETIQNSLSTDTIPPKMDDLVTIKEHHDEDDSSSCEQQTEVVPLDKGRMVFWIILLNGIGVLLPWNMFITIAPQYYVDYWFTVNGTKTHYADSFMSAMGLVAQIPNFTVAIINVLNIIHGPLIYRLVASLAVNSLLVCVILALVIFQQPSDEARNWFYIVSLIIIMAMNGSNGLTNSFFGLVADFPAQYSNAVVIGTNLCGIFTSILAIIATLAFSNQPENMALTYFGISLAILIICLFSWWFCKKLEFFNYHVSKGNKARAAQPQSSFDYRPYLETFKYCWLQYLCIFLVFFASLAVFPTILVEFSPTTKSGAWNSVIPQNVYIGITTFLNFNVLAAIGNVCAYFVTIPGPRLLIVPCLIRLIFIPFFMFGNCLPDSRTMPVLYSNEWVFFFANSILAFTGGYFSSLGIMYAPRVCPPEYSKLAGQMSSLSLLLGITAGVGFTYAVNAMIQNF